MGPGELRKLFQLAAGRKAVIYVHMRNGGPVAPGAVESLREMIDHAAATGASVHIVHITSMALRQTAQCLSMIEEARGRGLDITTEAYPYTAGMTDISYAVFCLKKKKHQGGITYKDLQWALTGE